MCRISYLQEDGLPLLILTRSEENFYGIGGTVLGFPRPSDERPEISARVGEQSVALLAPQTTVPHYADIWRTSVPLEALRELVEGEESFVLDVDGTETELALDGFVEAHEAMSECAAGLDMQLFPEPEARVPVLVAFDGMERLGAEASRQRLLSEKLGFTITVDATGKATDCDISRDFRRRATEIALCRPFLRDTTFEPARDAAGNPVEGTFYIEVDFDMWMTQRGYLEAEDR